MYCKEAYEDFIIDYAYYQYRQIKEKKPACSRLVRFHLIIIYSCTTLFILLQHKIESGNS